MDSMGKAQAGVMGVAAGEECKVSDGMIQESGNNHHPERQRSWVWFLPRRLCGQQHAIK